MENKTLEEKEAAIELNYLDATGLPVTHTIYSDQFESYGLSPELKTESSKLEAKIKKLEERLSASYYSYGFLSLFMLVNIEIVYPYRAAFSLLGLFIFIISFYKSYQITKHHEE